MTDGKTRKNLKIDVETYERLRDAKGQYETWDGCLNRLIEESQ
jgi:hypothetical protein